MNNYFSGVLNIEAIKMIKRIQFWIRRYGPAEIVCTILAVFSASVTYSITKNEIFTAIAGTWGENIGFYGVIILRDVLSNKNRDKNYNSSSIFKTIQDIIFEFGPAEFIDSFLSRPFMMYFFPKLIGNVELGIFVGKIVADLVCYIPIILSYEIQQKYKIRNQNYIDMFVKRVFNKN